MMIRSRGVLAVLAAASLFVTACSSTPAASSAPSEAASAGPSAAESVAAASEAPAGLPYTGTLKDGSTFTLASRIADKLASGEKINYLFSYQSSSIPLFSAQYQAGYTKGLADAQAILPMNGQIVAPAAAAGDVNEQIAQIQAQIDAGQVDCLSIEPATSDGFTKITNDTMAAGIPVFTVGVTSNGNEFTNFTQVPAKEGAQAAQIVLDWMKATGNDLKVFSVGGGDPTQFWAQGRMGSFVDTIKAAIPDAKFINEASTGLTTSYDPAQTYDAYKAFIQGNPDLQFIENVDIGAEHADKAITDAGLAGKIFTIGWNVSLGQLDGIDAGTQVAALDQRWGEQAGFGAGACAELLKNGKVLPNSQVLFPITKDNSAQAREDLNKILNP
jgi:ABC-type sugar transport system substrate-binding protein